jgi:hypothetical protein
VCGHNYFEMRFPRNEEINGRAAASHLGGAAAKHIRRDASSRLLPFLLHFSLGQDGVRGEIISKNPFSRKITHIMSQYSAVLREKMNNFHTHTHTQD